MPFERIENCSNAASKSRVPAEGVAVSCRKVARRKGGGLTRYIKVQVGAELARKLVWRGEDVRLSVAFGTDRDAGKVRLSVDVSAGDFSAKRDKKGNYALTINENTADGLFSLDFPAFEIAELQPVSVQGQPPALIFKGSDAMLKVEE